MPIADRSAPGAPPAPARALPPHPHALRSPLAPFTARLRDLLSTVESAALLGAVEARVRGLGEHLRFACLAMPCSEALVALEMEALGRLTVPVVANAGGYRTAGAELSPSGTPFAYLLGGGGGHAVALGDGDPMIAPLRPLLAAAPVVAIFVPIRVGAATVGGAALFSHDAALGGRELDMAERLAEVLALTVESFRTERIVFELFARAMPDLLEQAPCQVGAASPNQVGAASPNQVGAASPNQVGAASPNQVGAASPNQVGAASPNQVGAASPNQVGAPGPGQPLQEEAAPPPTSLRAALERHIHALRLTPEYRRRLELAAVVGRLAEHGEVEARLALDLLARIDAYARGGSVQGPLGEGEGSAA
ncbi:MULTISPECIES: hypothetical protein [Sorangium]|uniref:GAF domain-containing protein n=1 Tax=Sorangium cellulosum TaxID=56 RepID=A0A4P2QVV0_SORCE|nr:MULTISPECIES: hypothetical protein [Sorangium]AUX34569.1 hypothetical protein SOCE836_067430 [Sorangium cellulosum]WCQ93881.1 hypothetical protein NQZ70_06637 [Sorangium sp. Soce836]